MEKEERIKKSKQKTPPKKESKVQKPKSKPMTKEVEKSSLLTKKAEPSTTVRKSKGKESIRQRPHLLPSTLNNNDNNISSDEDDQTVEAVATDSRITYAIAMNNILAQEGTSNSGGGGSGSESIVDVSSGSNLVSEPSAATVGEVEAPCMSTQRYPRRARRAVDYREQLEPSEDDHFICKYYA